MPVPRDKSPIQTLQSGGGSPISPGKRSVEDGEVEKAEVAVYPSKRQHLGNVRRGTVLVAEREKDIKVAN